MSDAGLPRFYPDRPVDVARQEMFGAVLPFFVTYIFDEFVPSHVEQKRQDVAKDDARIRLEELLDEVEFCRATAVPPSDYQRRLSKRNFSWSRPSSDLRERRRRRPEAGQLHAEYDRIRAELEPLLPRRSYERISANQFRSLKELYPELSNLRRANTAGLTPAIAARQILSHRCGLTTDGVRKALLRPRPRRARSSTPSPK